MKIFDREIKRPSWVPQWLSFTLVVTVVFLVSLFFHGENNYTKTYRNNQLISELKQQIKMKEDSARYYENKVKELHTDRATLERIAREQYRMKRVGEDIYITDIP